MTANQLRLEFFHLEKSIDRMFDEFQEFLTDAKLLFEKAFGTVIDLSVDMSQSCEKSNDSFSVANFTESNETQVFDEMIYQDDEVIAYTSLGDLSNEPLDALKDEISALAVDEPVHNLLGSLRIATHYDMGKFTPNQDLSSTEITAVVEFSYRLLGAPLLQDVKCDDSVSELLEVSQNEAYNIVTIKFRGAKDVINFNITRDVESIIANNSLLAGILMVHSFEFQLLVSALLRVRIHMGLDCCLWQKKDYFKTDAYEIDSRLNLLLQNKSEKKLVVKENEVLTKLVNGIQLSLTQGIVLSYYRNYEIWVIGNLTLMLIDGGSQIDQTFYKRHLTDTLALGWRIRLTQNLLKNYLRNNAFYQVFHLSSEKVNADQSITDDLKKLNTNLSGLVTGMVKPFVDIWWFTWRMKLLTGRMDINILYAYMLLGLGLLRTVTLDFGNLASQKLLEETFRFMHRRLRTHAESIVLFGGSARKKAMVVQDLRSLLPIFIFLWKCSIIDG